MPRPAMLVSGGELRPATDDEVRRLRSSRAAASRLHRLPGIGKDGLAQVLELHGAKGRRPAEGLLITCTCGHLFLEQEVKGAPTRSAGRARSPE